MKLSNPPSLSVIGDTYLVFGLARTGMACVTWLLERGALVIVKDSDDARVAQALLLGAKTYDDRDIPWSKVKAVVQSPGIPLSHSLTQSARDHGILVCGDLDLFRWTHPDAIIVGITGTNGKSTTTALIAHTLKSADIPVAMGGNVGIPVLSLPDLSSQGIYVLELSSYQLDLSQGLALDHVGWLNITPDHLERHGSMDEYVRVKSKIFEPSFLGSFPQSVISVDDEYSRQVYYDRKAQYPDRVVSVSCSQGIGGDLHVQEGLLLKRGEQGVPQKIMDLRKFDRLAGQHNHQNCAVAYGICHAIGLTDGQIFAGFSSFPGLAHRQEWVAEIESVTFINDSKATNGEAAAKALDTFNQIYWIAGGEPKSDGIGMLGAYFSKIKHAYLIGAAQQSFAETIGGGVPMTLSGDLKTAIGQAFMAAREEARRDLASRPVVLFSPACASFDQFRDFEHRGDVFKELVSELS